MAHAIYRTKREKRNRNAISADTDSEIEHFARRNRVSIEEARDLVRQLGLEFASEVGMDEEPNSMTDGVRIVRMDVALHGLVKVELEQCRARWGECSELHALELNWGEALDDRRVLRLARRLHNTGSIYGHKAAVTS